MPTLVRQKREKEQSDSLEGAGYFSPNFIMNYYR